MSKLPTDREVFKCIYEMYESSYPGAQPGSSRGENDPYIAIDIPAVGRVDFNRDGRPDIALSEERLG